MIELQMERDGLFRLLEASLSEHGGTEHNDRGVQRAQGCWNRRRRRFKAAMAWQWPSN